MRCTGRVPRRGGRLGEWGVLGQELRHLSLLVDTGQVTLPAWASVFPSVKWQDRVAASTGLSACDQGQVRRPVKSHRAARLFQDGSLKILNAF